MISYLQNNNKLCFCMYLLLSQLLLLLLLPNKLQANESMIITAKAQLDATVTGKVTGEDGETLIGVSIRVKGTKIGTSTSNSGEYSITIPSSVSNAVLEVSYLGYVTQEVNVGGRTTINIELKSDVAGLNEVVVVGYNTVKKSDLTGSIVSITAEDIRSRPVVNALQAIQGKAAGVDITSNERPGEMGQILIRGARSLTATNSPLYVVDGIPLAAGGIEAINPNDIEAIDILKDASATAIYGSRGANGVIIVTTKRGKNGSLSLNYAGTTTIEKMYDRMEMMNAGEYVQFRRDANKITTPTLESDKLLFGQDATAWANVEKGWEGGSFDGSRIATTDWGAMVLKTGITQDHNLSVSGGTDKVKSYGSFGYLSQEGTQLGQDYKRYGANFSVDIKPLKWFAMGGSAIITYGIQNYGFATSNATGPGNLYAAAQGMLPFASPFDSNGNRINLPGGDINILNPIGEDKFNINQRKVLRTLGSLYAEVTILDGLKYRINFGPDFYNNNNGRWMDQNSINRGGGEPGSTNYAQLNQTSRLSYTLDHLIYYNKTINKHDFGVTLLQSSSSNRNETSTMTATKLPYVGQLWHQLNSVSALDGFGTDLIESSMVSYMGRFNYTFNNKYLFTASGRWDGSSVLAEGNKWDFFPSAALAWRVDQEDFIKDITWINQLKARIGVGSTGNAGVGAYTTKGRLQTLYYTFGGVVVPGYVASDASLANPILLPNSDLGWEHTTQYNLGLDFGFFNGRISGALDLYTSKTKDLLLEKLIPSPNGYVRSLVNVGATANKGIDLSINTINIKNKDFSWATTLNISANRDRIENLSNGKNDDIGNRWFIGEKLSSYYDYVKEGIWQNTPEDLAEIELYKENNGNIFNPGDIKIKDLNGDYKIDANNDMQIVGHNSPDWVGGISNTFTYKNFDLTFFIFSRLGYQIQTGAESLQGRFSQRRLDYWTPTNPTNDYPAPSYASAAGDAFKSSMNYQSASFVKIRDISLGYYLPDAVIKKLSLSKVKIYAQAINPGLIYSKIDWIDPDLGGSTFNRGFVLGLNVGF